MKSPLSQFHAWLQDAQDRNLAEPTAMALATVDAEGRPAVRMVLLKQADEAGFVFYTNTQSPKGQHLQGTPDAELCFYWNPPGRQVRIHGSVQPVTAEEADTYFASRPYQSRIGAWASQQSQPLHRQATLIKAAAAIALRYPIKVPRPPHWSGYRVAPQWMEFWEEKPFRLHDRFRYDRDAEGAWTSQRLNP